MPSEDATLGELYRRAGDLARARVHLDAARQQTSSPFDRELIDRRLAMCNSWPDGWLLSVDVASAYALEATPCSVMDAHS